MITPKQGIMIKELLDYLMVTLQERRDECEGVAKATVCNFYFDLDLIGKEHRIGMYAMMTMSNGKMYTNTFSFTTRQFDGSSLTVSDRVDIEKYTEGLGKKFLKYGVPKNSITKEEFLDKYLPEWRNQEK